MFVLSNSKTIMRMRSVFKVNLDLIFASLVMLSDVFVRADNPSNNDCLVLRSQLNNATSMFLKCAAENARPFNLCQSCVQFYLLVNQIHFQIIQVTKLAHSQISNHKP